MGTTLLVLAGALAGPAAAADAAPPEIDLRGAWEFRIDPEDAGIREKWFEGAWPAGRSIEVPGAWNAQGVGFDAPEALRRYLAKPVDAKLAGPGTEADRLFSVYPGPAWYRKAVAIPAGWSGKRVRLEFGGVHRTAEVWIDGKRAGGHAGYPVPFEFDVTGLVRPGAESAIVVRVDARRDRTADPLLGCMDTLDFLYITWGGIHRGARLTAGGDARIEDLFVVPRLADDAAEVRVAAGWAAGVPARSLDVRVEVLDAEGRPAAGAAAAIAGDGTAVVAAKLPGAARWSPARPYLYTARAVLLDGGAAVDERRARFGMREFRVEGSRFLLNGRPIFLRGYGDDCIYPLTIAPPADPAEYRARFRVAKDFGFNYVRHHSWIPTEEYLDAADEIGFLLQPELPIAYRWDLGESPAARARYLDVWREAIRRNRNHPSIAVWCMGNELYDGIPQAGELYRAARALDPTRPVIDSDGVARRPRPTLDFWPWQFDESGSFGFRDGKYRFGPTERPVIAHEMGYFVTLPDLAILDRFRGGLKPYWLIEARDNARQRGVEDAYPRWVDRSNRLQAVCLKTNIEAARRSNLQGYHVWLFADYPWCAEGVVDMFFRPKALGPGEFRKFNAPTVLLVEGDRRSFRGGEKAEIPVCVSRYEEEPAEGATLRWEVRAGDEVVASGSRAGLAVPCGEAKRIETITFGVPPRDRAAAGRLAVRLEDGRGAAENDWRLWFFPAARRPPDGVEAVGPEWLRRLYPGGAAEGAAAPGGVTGPGGVLVAARWGPDVLGRLASGGRALVLDPEPVFPAVVARYRPSGWDPGDPASHLGTAFDPRHPALRAMPSDGWCDLQFHDLIRGSKTMLLDATRATGEPIVRAIDMPQRLARKAWLYEAAAGGGKLLVSGFNFAGAVAAGDPAATFLLDELVRYAAGDDFRPSGAVPLEDLRAKLEGKR